MASSSCILHPVTMNDLPLELLSQIAAAVFWSAQAAPFRTLDPFVVDVQDGSDLASQYWPEPVMRQTLASLCRVNHGCAEAARPWLWRVVQVRLPRDWLALLDQTLEEVADGPLDGPADVTETTTAHGIPAAESSAASTPSSSTSTTSSCFRTVTFADVPGMSIPPELLSPPASREPSPRRLRSKSRGPARWEVIRSLTRAMENMMRRQEPAYFVEAPYDTRWGRFVTRLDFNHFRTINMRRSVEDGVKNRFVTGDRLEALLKEMPNLVKFGSSEYMDSALTLGVLKELLLRGSGSAIRGRGRRALVDDDDTDRDRLREFADLEAIDFTGCVSATFVGALTAFADTYLRPKDPEAVPVELAGLRRLGLRGVKAVSASVLEALICACSALTHLDVSCTRVSPALLEHLAQSPTIRLQSLSLERCPHLSGESIVTFLATSSAVQNLQELNLHADLKVPSPLSEDDLQAVLSSPCFIRGSLVYLDISGAPLTPEILATFPAQPSLRSLGLSFIPRLPLAAVRDFIRDKASNTEVLTLVGSTPELAHTPMVAPTGGRRATLPQATYALHSQLVAPLSAPPVRWSISGRATAAAPTRLRVIELAGPLVNALQLGSCGWRVVRSKGGRAWYVDSASGWVASEGRAPAVLQRDLPEGHPHRLAIDRLGDANGNVSSGVGWHARKMEIIQGDGMLGREEGLYGAVAFAYQG